MLRSGPITMLRFSISRPVFRGELERNSTPPGQIGLTAVQLADWWEKHGDTVTFKSECWKQVAPDIWQAT